MDQPHSPKSVQSRQISWTVHFGLALFISLSSVWIHAFSVAPSARREIRPTIGIILAQGDQEVRQLELGKPIERELAGGQSHSYQVTLDYDQYLHLVVDQRGIDVVVMLFGPGGSRLVEIDSPNGTQGLEPVLWLTKAAGTYRLEVRSLEQNAAAGRYEVKIVELRASTAQDQTLMEASKLASEAVRLRSKGKYDEAIPLAERALSMKEKVLGPNHQEVADLLDDLAELYEDKADYAQAEPLYQRVLMIWERGLGQDHPNVAIAHNKLAQLNQAKGNYTQAESHYQRALAIREKARGPNHPSVAEVLNNLGGLYRAKGDFLQAEPLLQRALTIREKALGLNHPGVATALNNLAGLCEDKGDYIQAEPLYQRSLEIREKALGPHHPTVAVVLNNLALLYYKKGDYLEAEPLFLRALTIKEKTFGPNHPDLASSLNNLALLHYKKGDYAQAEQLMLRALAIREKALDPNHPSVAQSLNNLGELYRAKGDFLQAEPLLQRALTIREKTLGPNHPGVAIALNNLASLYEDKGGYTQAEQLFHRALAIEEKALGPHHPSLAASLTNMARLSWVNGETQQAVELQNRANEIGEFNLSRNLVAGSERQKLAYLALFSKGTNFTLSLHSQAAPRDQQALHLAFTTLLRRKGRCLDAMADTIAALRRHATPDNQALFDQLIEVRSQYAALRLRESGTATPDNYQKQLKPLEEKIEKLEAELSARSIEFRAQSQSITLAAVQAALPSGSTLVEFTVYTPLDPRAGIGKPPRYLAYLLTAQGEPRWVDLGEAMPIDRAIDAWRKALRDPERKDVRRLARAVDEKVMRPVRSLLGETRRLLIAPDGLLNLIPFSALLDNRNQYLIARYDICYLTSGGDLLRLQTPLKNKEASLVMANPAFGKVVTIASQADGRDTIQIDRTKVFFQPLPATEDEALAIKTVLPESAILLREQATEAAIKRASSPRILHIATHGFFLRDQETPPAESRGAFSEDPLRTLDLRMSKWLASVENPLLRSGLALAGANQGKSGEDDGVLTAMEAAGLDLWGTKLVVLSACDTGVGEVKNGEGVQGLRRALVLAGSESQVMSLWPVPDEATKELMIPYYKALQQGQGRSEGLRQVQLRMLRSKNRQHPFYWAAFIQSGEWGNLDGRR